MRKLENVAKVAIERINCTFAVQSAICLSLIALNDNLAMSITLHHWPGLIR